MHWHPNPTERRAFASKKWSSFPEHELPLWVADMDCAPPSCVRTTIEASITHGIFGYGSEPKHFREVWATHLLTRHDWKIDPDWIVPIAGVVPGMRFSLMAFPDIRHVLSPSPAYPYFQTVPRIEQRTSHPMRLHRQKWGLEPSFDNMNDQLQAIKAPAAILWCNPQNPGGTVYSGDQIQRLVGIGAKHDSLIVSDEIWADLILDDDQHIPLGRVAPTTQPTITLMAATKTFNVAGFGCAVAIIPEPKTRQRFLYTQIGMPNATPLAYAVTESCLRNGWDWHHELLQALRSNRQTVLDWATQHPEFEVTTGHATFLAWIESHQRADLAEYFAKRGVRLSPGKPFGSETAVRLNFGCSSATLSEALRRMDAR